MRYLKQTIIFALIALPFRLGAAESPQTELGKLLRTEIQRYVQGKFALSVDDLLLEFPNLPDMTAENLIFDEIRVLPSRKPIRKGVQLIRCGLFSHGQLSETVNVNVRVRTFQTIVVSKRKISRLAILKQQDLKLVRLETTKLSRRLFFSIEEVLGLRTTRLLQAGKVITDNLVEQQPVVARGTDVDIHFKKGVLVITTPGVARQDGRTGEEILVKCLENKKVFSAEVLDANTVLVQL